VTIIISTLLFLERPSAVLFVSTGRVSENPLYETVSGLTPSFIRKSATRFALLSEKNCLRLLSPTESEWPSILNSTPGYFFCIAFNISAIRLSSFSARFLSL
jgi:hypothetical protein